jgi:hypothetical protein
MTPEERARDVVDSMGDEISMPYLCAIKIEKAIKAAIEEDRKTRDCCLDKERDDISKPAER